MMIFLSVLDKRYPHASSAKDTIMSTKFQNNVKKYVQDTYIDLCAAELGHRLWKRRNDAISSENNSSDMRNMMLQAVWLYRKKEHYITIVNSVYSIQAEQLYKQWNKWTHAKIDVSDSEDQKDLSGKTIPAVQHLPDATTIEQYTKRLSKFTGDDFVDMLEAFHYDIGNEKLLKKQFDKLLGRWTVNRVSRLRSIIRSLQRWESWWIDCGKKGEYRKIEIQRSGYRLVKYGNTIENLVTHNQYTLIYQSMWWKK